MSPSGSMVAPTCTDVTGGGQIAWAPPSSAGCSGAITDSTGTTYLSDDGTAFVEALDSSGNQLWRTDTSSIGSGAYPFLGADGNVYFVIGTGTGSELVGFDKHTGAMTTPRDVTGQGAFSPYNSGYGAADSGGGVSYHSYNGTYLAGYSNGGLVFNGGGLSASPGADGSVFVAGYNNCSSSAQLSVLKVTPSGVVWTWTDPNVSNGCEATHVTPTPDGGVVEAGDAGTPGQVSFVSISPSGTERWTQSPSGQLGPGLWADWPVVDVNGVVALPYQEEITCSDGTTNTCAGLHIDFVSEATGAQALPAFDWLDTTDSNVYGSFGEDEYNIDAGRLYIVRKINYLTNLYAYSEAGLAMNYALALQDGITTSASGYVAMGDSYSAGEGLAPYLDTSGCDRSSQAYGPELDTALNLGSLTFAACSGAVTQDFLTISHDHPGVPAQVSELQPDTTSVTFTIGGNDVGFADVLDKCIHGIKLFHWRGYGCSKDKSLVSEVDARISALHGVGGAANPDGITIVPIQDLISRIHQIAPQATIAVAGYPALFGSTSSTYAATKSAPSKYACQVGAGGTIDFTDAQWLNQEQVSLDNAIAAAVLVAQAQGIPVHYVDTVPSDFAGHGLCDSSQQWINGLSLSGLEPWPGSFHPTATGQSSGYELAFSGLPSF